MLRLSKLTDYATVVMTRLAQTPGEVHSAQALAERTLVETPTVSKVLKKLARAGEYDGVAFHRVIEGFMAQTGDVEHGDVDEDYDPRRVGTGGSDLPDLEAEFSDVPFERGAVGMARAQDPDSANSQFFIMFAPAPHLNGQYTVWGRVIDGMDHVDRIKPGAGRSGSVEDPDRMVRVYVAADR
jgi:cyclophilin family peptidyl-prolyl cis-trans isomerase